MKFNQKKIVFIQYKQVQVKIHFLDFNNIMKENKIIHL